MKDDETHALKHARLDAIDDLSSTWPWAQCPHSQHVGLIENLFGKAVFGLVERRVRTSSRLILSALGNVSCMPWGRLSPRRNSFSRAHFHPHGHSDFRIHSWIFRIHGWLFVKRRGVI